MKKLKKILVLFLMLVLTIPSEVAHIISFVPEFISHYNHHNEEHHQLSFIDFVGEHFNDNHHESSDKHEKDECPIKHNHPLVSFTYVIEKKVAFENEVETIPFYFERNPLPPYQSFFSEFHSTIWQPPKLV